MDEMLSQSHLHSPFTCKGLLSVNVVPKLSVGQSKKVARLVHISTVNRKALTFAHPPRESPTCGAFLRQTSSVELNHQQSVHQKRKWSVKNRSMGGGSVLPHAAATASKSRGVSATSRLEDRDRVVIVDHGSCQAQSNAMLHEFVKMYKEETDHQLVEATHMELETPTIADAFDHCMEQGATCIIICPYFLFPGCHWNKDIPALAVEAVRKHPQMSYLVTTLIGLHKLMVTVIQDRMDYCVSQTVGEVAECEMCQGTGRCK